MRSFTPDVSKIIANPFGFKSDRAEAAAHLEQSLRDLASFFDAERAGDDEVYEAWNRFQSRRSGPAVVHFTSSIRSVMAQKAELEAAKSCQVGHSLVLTERVFVLSYVGLLESVEKAGGSRASVKRALLRGLPEAHKQTLLHGFSFSEEYALGTGSQWPMHLHCRKRKSQVQHVHDFCGSYCDRPNPTEVQELFPALANHLYDMRCDYVHAAAAVLFANPDTTPSDGESGGSTLYDVYFTHDETLVQYLVWLGFDELFGILRRCLWNRLLNRTP